MIGNFKNTSNAANNVARTQKGAGRRGLGFEKGAWTPPLIADR